MATRAGKPKDTKDETTVELTGPDGKSTGPIPMDVFRSAVDAIGAAKREIAENKIASSYIASYSPDRDAPEVKEDKYWMARSDGFREAVRGLLYEHFTFLGAVKIAYVFQAEHTSVKGKAVAAKVAKQSDLQMELHGKEVALVIAWDLWEKLTNFQREALLFHEFSHLMVDDKGVEILPHDLEFFIPEYKRFGAWNQDLQRLADSIKQMELFDKDGKASAAPETDDDGAL